MSGCNCSKNQTHKDVFEYAKSRKLRINQVNCPTRGVGLFLIPAPDKGILELKVIYVDDISYHECVRRGENCEAFQWIPKGITVKLADKDKTIETLEHVIELGGNCGDPCGSYCVMGCVCGPGDLYCRPN